MKNLDKMTALSKVKKAVFRLSDIDGFKIMSFEL
jgi:hypothetical protein